MRTFNVMSGNSYNYHHVSSSYSELSASVTDLQDQLNKLIEDSALYQVEVDEEQETNKESIQRLRDENRELVEELAILRNLPKQSPRKSPRLISPRKSPRSEPKIVTKKEHLCEKCGKKSSPIRLVKLQKVDPVTLKSMGMSPHSSPGSPLVRSRRATSGNATPEKAKPTPEKSSTPPPKEAPVNRARSSSTLGANGLSTPRVSTPRPVLTPRLQALSTPRKFPTTYLVATPQKQASLAPPTGESRSRSKSVPQKQIIEL
jgi:hypothetical protein